MCHPVGVLVQGAIRQSRQFSPGYDVSPLWGERQGRPASFAIVAQLRRLKGGPHHSPWDNPGIKAIGINFRSSSRLGPPPAFRMKFVFSVCRLVSRRCHNISSVPELFPSPAQNRTSGFPTSDSSVNHSVSLRSTTRVQVSADTRLRPDQPSYNLIEPGPVISLTLALAVEPLERNPGCVKTIFATAP